MKKKILIGTLMMVALAVALPNMAKAATAFQTIFGGICSTYQCWIEKAWNWSMGVIVPLSVLILTAAGVIYMTSEGDSSRVGLAKKMLIGVASGVALLVLARFLLIGIIGISGDQYQGAPTTNPGTSSPSGSGGGFAGGGGSGGGGTGGGAD